MAFVKHVTFRTWAGAVVRGTRRWSPPTTDKSHITRAFWLASRVEVSGIFGTVQCYDGAGMSAGLEHKIALFPKTMLQGPLFKVIDKMRDDPTIAGSKVMKDMMAAIDKAGWVLDPAGILVKKVGGKKVTGAEIRKEFTPPGGTVPGSGPAWEQCKRWTLLFHNLFADPITSDIQVRLGKASINALADFEKDVYQKLFCVTDPSSLVAGVNIRMDQDLALCTYHSHAVNAPAIAKRVLLASNPDKTADWPGRFLKMLNDTKYARWDRRWIHTRMVALDSGLWPRDLFDGPNEIMPEDP